MDSKTAQLVAEWRASWTPKERELHDLATVMLKKNIKVDLEKDNGSYYAEKCHAFRAWRKANNK